MCRSAAEALFNISGLTEQLVKTGTNTSVCSYRNIYRPYNSSFRKCWFRNTHTHTHSARAAWSANRSQTHGFTLSLVYKAVSSSHLQSAQASSTGLRLFLKITEGLRSLPHHRPPVWAFPNFFLRNTGTLPGQSWYSPHDDFAKFTGTLAVHLLDGTARLYVGFSRGTSADSWETLRVISALEGLAWRATRGGKATIYKRSRRMN